MRFARFGRFFFGQKLSLPSFKEYNFHPKVQEVLDKKEFYTPSPIQDMSITEIRKNNYHNLVLIAPTGTGKTLSYCLPLIDQLKKEEESASTSILTEPQRVRSLIVVPTKELVEQVTDTCKEFGHVVKLRCFPLINSQKFTQEKRVLLTSGTDIVVGTIDRIERHQQKEQLFISKVRFLVIDEVDTLIDSGNEEYLGNICKSVLKRQRSADVQQPPPKILLVGATLTGKFQRFAKAIFGEDIKFLVEKNTHMHLEHLSHEFIHCQTLDKTQPLLRILNEIGKRLEGVIIFCNSISSCQFLERSLQENGHKAVSLHGSVPKNIRQQNFNLFRGRQVKIMVATDLAARGLDFPFLSHVINFDFPQSTSDYLHRAGRTGRAGKKGFIYSLYHNKDQAIIDELNEANLNKTPVSIKGSSYSKINREVLQNRQESSKPQPNLQKINDKQGLNLPKHYLDMRKRFRQSDGTPGYKPQKRRGIVGRRALGEKSRGQMGRK